MFLFRRAISYGIRVFFCPLSRVLQIAERILRGKGLGLLPALHQEVEVQGKRLRWWVGQGIGFAREEAGGGCRLYSSVESRGLRGVSCDASFVVV